MLNGYKIPVTTSGIFHNVVWGEPEEVAGVGSPMEIAVTVHADGKVRVIAKLVDGGIAWCERRSVEGDNVLDYVRVALDDSDYASGTNGYYVEWPTDDDGSVGTHRLDDGSATQPTMVIWRNEKLR